MLGVGPASKGKMERLPMPSIRLDHIAIALPRIADAPSVLVTVLGGVPEQIQPSREVGARLGIRLALWSA